MDVGYLHISMMPQYDMAGYYPFTFSFSSGQSVCSHQGLDRDVRSSSGAFQPVARQSEIRNGPPLSGEAAGKSARDWGHGIINPVDIQRSQPDANGGHSPGLFARTRTSSICIVSPKIAHRLSRFQSIQLFPKRAGIKCQTVFIAGLALNDGDDGRKSVVVNE